MKNNATKTNKSKWSRTQKIHLSAWDAA